MFSFSDASVFQFTTSQGGRPSIPMKKKIYIYFNSRPHKEVDDVVQVGDRIYIISIHDLTRRSTRIRTRDTTSDLFQFTTSQGGRRIRITVGILVIHISIHDLTRRSTIFVKKSMCNSDKFQFTTSQGGRPVRVYMCQRVQIISIHDLTRRSTHWPHRHWP